MVSSVPWLTLLWAIPMVGAVVVMLLPAAARVLVKWVALTVSLVVLVVAAVVAVGFDPGGEQFQFVESHRWIPSFGTGYILGVDGIALALVVLTAVLMPILLVAGWNDARDELSWGGRSVHVYVALTLAVEGMVLISLVSLDILLFYVFFEAMLIPMYFLIGGFGGGQRGPAAVKFLLYNLFGGLIMLAAIVGLYVTTAGSDAFPAGTFDFRAIVAAVAAGDFAVNPMVMHLLFGGFMFAFAIKAPLWPLHRWLPDSAVQATPASAVLMMAIMDKVGTFGMIRYCLPLFPDSAAFFAPAIVTLSVIGIIYGAVVAIGQTDVMRLIAYTSISHFGFIILGIFVMTSQGQAGSTLYMVNHGISTAALFLIAGFLVSRRGSRLISAYGGVQKVAPVLAGTFLVAGLATLSLPGLAPFISEFLVLIGTFTRYPLFGVLAATALVLSAIYILWMYQRMMTGPLPRDLADGESPLRDLIPREIVVVAPLIALLLVLGVYPKPALDVIDPAVSYTLTTIDQRDPSPHIAEGLPR
ncbi:MAG: NADH-quinone oxidoreductase subunit M [Actinomycetota bacterium]|nr:NADH-quinone oxidoreductase subunit M [Actinomycetota bacterium]